MPRDSQALTKKRAKEVELLGRIVATSSGSEDDGLDWTLFRFDLSLFKRHFIDKLHVMFLLHGLNNAIFDMQRI